VCNVFARCMQDARKRSVSVAVDAFLLRVSAL
jgi:hypothetical protein